MIPAGALPHETCWASARETLESAGGESELEVYDKNSKSMNRDEYEADDKNSTAMNQDEVEVEDRNSTGRNQDEHESRGHELDGYGSR